MEPLCCACVVKHLLPASAKVLSSTIAPSAKVTPCKIQDAYILKYILPKAQAPHQAPPPANLPICQSQTLAEEGKGSTI